ncbi:MAG: nicotinate phosphoribosyltransferase [Gemmatimonadetes bacterium]|nr:nicotinate phosphoribosyltransferase [Gemmatimonadota bacterium]
MSETHIRGESWPDAETVGAWTDTYFKRSRAAVERFGDQPVTYALFVRRPVVSAPRIALGWIEAMAEARGFEIEIDLRHEEGRLVGAGEPICYVTGSFEGLVDLETVLLMKLGAPCVAAHQAYAMCAALPAVAFLAMDARHCAGTEMAELMAYAASVGSARARRKDDAIGFVGTAIDATARYFGQTEGKGTMPHALVGYAGSTVRAAEMLAEVAPDEPLTVLVDYFGREVSDSLEVCRRFADRAEAGELAVRIDTPGGRFLEGLDPPASYAALERNAPGATRGYRTDSELRHLVGPGVSAAAIWFLRERLDEEGFDEVRIVASSGFGPEKCRMMAAASAPIDVIGTGSYLPDRWTETYATADIVAYDGVPRVKAGREYLISPRPSSAPRARRARGSP